MEYIARFSSESLKKQTVKEHIQGVAILARYFGKKIGIENLLFLAGLLHDMGKYGEGFQKYIKERYDEAQKGNRTANGVTGPDHGVFGGKYIFSKYSEINVISRRTAEILALTCCYHHGGLPDCVNNQNEVTLEERLNRTSMEEMNGVVNLFIADNPEVDLEVLFNAACGEIEDIFQRLKEHISEEKFTTNLIIKTIYSMLIDSDRYDSYIFEKDAGHDDYRFWGTEELVEVWSQYSTVLEDYLNVLETKGEAVESDNRKMVNEIRHEISEECLNAANKDSGIYTLTVPTGGGKTLASLRFAINHAKAKGKERIIYVLPFTTIIEQNAEEVRKALKCGEDLLEHHSNVMEEKKAEEYQLLTQRWSNRVIFTTMVQFLNTFYDKDTQDTRRLHNLLNSVIVFDEVQKVPVKCIDLFNSAMNFLTQIGNSTAVFCTATQPALNEANVGIIGLDKNCEIIKNVADKFNSLERVSIVDECRPGGYTYSEIADLILEKKKSVNSLLMVVNTVSSAEILYKIVCSLKNDRTKIYLLTTRLCPPHRKVIIKSIIEGLEKGEPLICISTQLIEAGVDISFDVGIRSLAGLDSIIQTAGRVNRHGEREKGYCYIVNIREESLAKLREIQLGAKHANEVLNSFKRKPEHYENSLLSPKAITEYFEYFFADKEINENMTYPIKEENSSIYQMLSNLKKNTDNYKERCGKEYPLLYKYNFERAGRGFEVIEGNTKTVVVPYGRGRELIEILSLSNNRASISDKKKFLSEIGQFSVNIPTYLFDKLVEWRAITTVPQWGISVLSEQYYSMEKGLITEKQEMEALIM